jgi:hypothetical protein
VVISSRRTWENIAVRVSLDSALSFIAMVLLAYPVLAVSYQLSAISRIFPADS